MKTTVASVVFLEALEFLDDFVISLQRQDCQEFDVLLINDNIPMDMITDRLKKYRLSFTDRVHIADESTHKLLPFELRIELLYEALTGGTELLILLDCDDMAKSNRVSEVVKQYDEKYDFYYNDIFLFNGKRAMPKLPKITNKIDYLLEHNYLGLSNCAINMKHIRKDFVESLREGTTQVFDWYLFSRMLLSGMTGKYIGDTGTYYRIYADNTAGIPKHTVRGFEKERDVKLKHYGLLKKYDERYRKLIGKYENLDISRYKLRTDSGLYFWWGMLSEWGDE